MSGLNTGYGRNLSQSKMKIFLPHIKRFCAVLKSVFEFKRPTLFADLGTSPLSEGDLKFLGEGGLFQIYLIMGAYHLNTSQ